VVTFEGRVRNQTGGRRVRFLEYEAYESMAASELERIRDEALRRWPLRSVSIVHRLGRVEIDEPSVFIVVGAGHRAEAFEACRWVIDTLKNRAPIWKKEYFEDGEVWVESESHGT
jgi:molybdopterin synthase catalytic subunit